MQRLMERHQIKLNAKVIPMNSFAVRIATMTAELVTCLGTEKLQIYN